jgi:hypothetical protein
MEIFMATEITLSLPDNVYNHAAHLAQLTNQDVSRVLTETIESVLSPLGADALALAPVEKLSDSEVLAAAELRMNAAQGRRLGLLLERQQASELDETERSELAALMQVYHENLLRKAQAMREAVQRGLREPLEP